MTTVFATTTCASAVPALPAVSPTTRVLHIINGEHYSGAERVQDLLAGALPGTGYEVLFASLKPGRFAGARKNTACILHEVPMRSRWDRSVAGRIAAIARDSGCRLVHAHTPRSLLVGAAVTRQSGLPLVYHVHSPVGRDSGRWLRNRINTWLESRMLARCSHMICVSESLREYMLGLGHPADRISVVRNGVPCADGACAATPSTGLWTLGVVALFRPRKGLELLLEGLRRLRDAGAGVRLLAVGPFESPDYEAAIRELVRRLGVADMIEWTGFERDVNRRLRQMQALVLPSLYGEGLPMVVLEAMACGVPVIASRVEGVPEAVRDGSEGMLFDPGDAGGLAGCVQQMLACPDQWRRMGENARSRQRGELSDQAMAQGVAQVYDRVLSRG